MLPSRFRTPSWRQPPSVRWLRSHLSPVLVALVVLALVAAGLVVAGLGRSGHRAAHPSSHKPAAPVVGELAGRRTATSTARLNKDGSYTTTGYGGPANYPGRDGACKPSRAAA